MSKYITANNLDDVIQENKKIGILDNNTISFLHKAENYTMPYRTFLSNLKVCCSIFNTKYYSNYYVELKKVEKKWLN